jgi:peptidoglycan/xylan/chitin deacetylase (PgdA/CDA1 family)
MKKKILIVIGLIIALCASIIIYDRATINNTYTISEKNLYIPIFVYHDLVENDSEIDFDYMKTTTDKFKKQILGLKKLGYQVISYQDLYDYKNNNKALPKKCCIITFDDGYESIYKYAFPIAKEYNIPMTSFAIDNMVGKPNYYTWDEAREMHDSGLMSIYSHGLEHIEYDKVDATKVLEDTNKAYEHLTTELNDPDMLKVFTYPYGLYSEESVKLLEEAGYIQNLTDNLVNRSKTLNLSKLHREYPLNDSVFKIIIKTHYRVVRHDS